MSSGTCRRNAGGGAAAVVAVTAAAAAAAGGGSSSCSCGGGGSWGWSASGTAHLGVKIVREGEDDPSADLVARAEHPHKASRNVRPQHLRAKTLEPARLALPLHESAVVEQHRECGLRAAAVVEGLVEDEEAVVEAIGPTAVVRREDVALGAERCDRLLLEGWQAYCGGGHGSSHALLGRHRRWHGQLQLSDRRRNGHGADRWAALHFNSHLAVCIRLSPQLCCDGRRRAPLAPPQGIHLCEEADRRVSVHPSARHGQAQLVRRGLHGRAAARTGGAKYNNNIHARNSYALRPTAESLAPPPGCCCSSCRAGSRGEGASGRARAPRAAPARSRARARSAERRARGGGGACLEIARLLLYCFIRTHQRHHSI